MRSDLFRSPYRDPWRIPQRAGEGGSSPSLDDQALALSPFIMTDTTNAANLFTDTTRTTPVTTNGDLVSGITDLSGNDIHPFQATAASRGLYTSGTTSKLFNDGADDNYEIPSITVPAGYTIVAGIDVSADPSSGDGMLLFLNNGTYACVWGGSGSPTAVGNLAGSSYLCRINGVEHTLSTRGALATALAAVGGPAVLSFSAVGSTEVTQPSGARILTYSNGFRVGGPIYGFAGFPLLTGDDLGTAESWMADLCGVTL